MAAMQEDNPAPAIRFKRRKTAHPRRVPLEDDAPVISASQSPDAATPGDAPTPPDEFKDEEESVPNLKEILRNRKRPRDRLKETARKAEGSSTALVQVDAPRPNQYTSRFVAQTGQVVDRDDKQMSEYVDARMAEKNFRQYGWPIPEHLQASVAAIAPELKHTFTATSLTRGTASGAGSPADTDHSNRLAAGQGKLQEVDLGPDATKRTEEAWRRLAEGEPEPPASKVRRDKYGYAWRKPKKNGKTDEDIRREQMVEAVLQEAKLDYFDAPVPAKARTPTNTDNDDALVEQFRTEYFEAMEARRRQHAARSKPAQPTAKGAPPPLTGPKLGGSKSARAKMHKALQEEAAKKKR
ncbi:hypothetical protein BDW02DRAFT_502952 [Decorospora gaudefroyi]|uniref:Uncharacterized protein n=1 Tax=Decorospora gaudefroyi TaxID=184978 RepID=A0A6A5K5L7_9PLEO|nr:hypothetical protein BDW02DRAFT_502952 [Decorospora gaudefroyi]